MSAKDNYRFWLRVRKEAARFAVACDMSPATRKAIVKAGSNSTTDSTIVSVSFSGEIVRAQILASLCYACCLLGASLSFSADETITTSNGEKIMMLDVEQGGTK